MSHNMVPNFVSDGKALPMGMISLLDLDDTPFFEQLAREPLSSHHIVNPQPASLCNGYGVNWRLRDVELLKELPGESSADIIHQEHV